MSRRAKRLRRALKNIGKPTAEKRCELRLAEDTIWRLKDPDKDTLFVGLTNEQGKEIDYPGYHPQKVEFNVAKEGKVTNKAAVTFPQFPASVPSVTVGGFRITLGKEILIADGPLAVVLTLSAGISPAFGADCLEIDELMLSPVGSMMAAVVKRFNEHTHATIDKMMKQGFLDTAAGDQLDKLNALFDPKSVRRVPV